MVAVPTTVVRFKCRSCGVNATATVPARASTAVDVAYWMEQIAMNAVGKEHERLRPWCQCRVFDLLLPLGAKDEKDIWIGKATGHVPPAKILDKDKNE